MSPLVNTLTDILLSFVPNDGSAIAIQPLKQQFIEAAQSAGIEVNEKSFESLREQLVSEGVLIRGRGRGGSVRLAEVLEDDSLESDVVEEDDTNEGEDFGAAGVNGGSTTSSSKRGKKGQVISYRHTDKRKNNPEVGMVTPATDPDDAKTTWAYDPHIDPVLQFDVSRAQLEKLIDDALASGDAATMREALKELKRLQQPYLNWAGKAERTSFEVDTVSLHVHERIDPMSILVAVRKRMQEARATASATQLELFAPPFENLPLREAIDFYKHEKGWSNRLIAGDSLLVINSLLKKVSAPV